tara:strand:- start:42 stop:527 length:486 start_codon:yes stop_codon:yes gene_type:complete
MSRFQVSDEIGKMHKDRKEKESKIKKEIESKNKTTPEQDAGMKDTKKTAQELNKAANKNFEPKKEAATAMDKYGAQLKALLSNKEKLVGTAVKGDSRNKYQIQINELKKRMKADGMKFNSLLKDVKKQEREGTFDRGAEGKTKNKLRQKMQSEKIGGSRGR